MHILLTVLGTEILNSVLRNESGVSQVYVFLEVLGAS